MLIKSWLKKWTGKISRTTSELPIECDQKLSANRWHPSQTQFKSWGGQLLCCTVYKAETVSRKINLGHEKPFNSSRCVYSTCSVNDIKFVYLVIIESVAPPVNGVKLNFLSLNWQLSLSDCRITFAPSTKLNFLVSFMRFKKSEHNHLWLWYLKNF